MRQWGKHCGKTGRSPGSGMLCLDEFIILDVCGQLHVDVFVMEQLRPPEDDTQMHI
jgi:hypothetical protein